MLLLLATSALAAAAPAAATQHVYIIRHGEKEGADGHLSPAGVARSHALPNIFNAQPSSHHATFGKPTALFAHYYTKSSGQSERCVATLAPIAAADDLRTNSSFGSDPSLGGNGAAAYAIKAALARGHHTVLVAVRLLPTRNLPLLHLLPLLQLLLLTQSPRPLSGSTSTSRRSPRCWESTASRSPHGAARTSTRATC